ncbi:hypothetical protein EGR_06314 [Echinococcus granulosus]|uniref:Uncharacterized protein n=1 Tax=Echinococcus granulosus TaxID=6210 RepID=W6UCB9_ECHGR|nr:hypothetical protein EGR_06314 [Echinococcus granulosus]EUB58890.1 hypothetical protein EGR_06314 [Echinococcus granulosus]
MLSDEQILKNSVMPAEEKIGYPASQWYLDAPTSSPLLVTSLPAMCTISVGTRTASARGGLANASVIKQSLSALKQYFGHAREKRKDKSLAFNLA